MEEKYTLKKPESIKGKKRIGRGMSSGHGKTSCRGQKGQLSRSGSKKRVWFEGGQMPLQRRIPKRGFNNIFKKYFQIVNLSEILQTDLNEITPEILADNKIVKHSDKMIKILGTVDLKKAVTITADAFSIPAINCIENAGGKAIIRSAHQKKV